MPYCKKHLSTFYDKVCPICAKEHVDYVKDSNAIVSQASSQDLMSVNEFKSIVETIDTLADIFDSSPVDTSSPPTDSDFGGGGGFSGGGGGSDF